MSFEEMWKDVKTLGVLPEAALLDLPSSLAEETKRKLCTRKTDEVVEILMDAISEINKGSLETLNSLVKKRLDF